MNSTAEKAGELRVALARAGWRRAEARVDDPWTLRARGQAEDPTDGFEASLLVEWGLALDLGPDPRHVVEAEVASARVGEPFTLAPLPPADLRQDGRRPPQVVLDEIPTSLRPAEPSVVWLLKNASSWSVAGSDQRFAVRAHLKQWCPRPFAEHLSALFVAHAGRSRLGAPVRPSRAVGVTADPSFELDDALAALRPRRRRRRPRRRAVPVAAARPRARGSPPVAGEPGAGDRPQ